MTTDTKTRPTSKNHKRGADGAPPVSFADIEAARARIDGGVRRTPTWPAPKLGGLAGCTLYVKYENMQYTGAFKERGALSSLTLMNENARAAGVAASSAGNHAQGVAYHASRLGISATIVMPEQTPYVKVSQTRDLGAKVHLAGASYEDAEAEARALCEREGRVFMHPFDDAGVIAGQGTLALEMLEDCPDIDTLLVPIGGGGLIAGVALAARQIKPSIEIIGVQSDLYPGMHAHVNGLETESNGGSTLAEGIAVKRPRGIAAQMVAELVDDIVLVEERALERAVALYLNVQKTVAEGAGAAGLAALLSDPERFKGRVVGTVLTGGNLDDRLLASVLMRELYRGGRIAHLRIDLLDVPGELAKISGLIAEMRANVIDVSHRRQYGDLPAKRTHMEIAIETNDRHHLAEILGKLRAQSYNIEVLTE